jgi:predicted nucleic acid-binding protein
MTLVVDARVALKWYLIEDGADQARQILADGATLVAPELVVAEVCNACWLACRRGEISAIQQTQIATDITRVFDRLERLALYASRAATIAHELDHPVYDCFYWP